MRALLLVAMTFATACGSPPPAPPPVVHPPAPVAISAPRLEHRTAPSECEEFHVDERRTTPCWYALPRDGIDPNEGLAKNFDPSKISVRLSVVTERITSGSEATFAISYRNESDRAVALDLQTEAEHFGLSLLDAKGQRIDQPRGPNPCAGLPIENDLRDFKHPNEARYRTVYTHRLVLAPGGEATFTRKLTPMRTGYGPKNKRCATVDDGPLPVGDYTLEVALPSHLNVATLPGTLRVPFTIRASALENTR